MSSAHSFITEAQIDLVFTFILFPICLGSTLESIPVGCRPTLHWAFSVEPWTKPCRSKRLSVWPISEKFQLAAQHFFFYWQSCLDFSGCLLMCNNNIKTKQKKKNNKNTTSVTLALLHIFPFLELVKSWRTWVNIKWSVLQYCSTRNNVTMQHRW